MTVPKRVNSTRNAFAPGADARDFETLAVAGEGCLTERNVRHRAEFVDAEPEFARGRGRVEARQVDAVAEERQLAGRDVQALEGRDVFGVLHQLTVRKRRCDAFRAVDQHAFAESVGRLGVPVME